MLQFGSEPFSAELVFGGSSSGDDGERNASPDSLAQEAGDLEVSSRRVSPDPARPEGNPMVIRSPQYPALEESNQKSPAPSGMRSGVLKGLLERATISEEHHTLMCTVIERISSAENGLHEAFMSLLTGFEVREMIYICDSTAHFRCALCRL